MKFEQLRQDVDQIGFRRPSRTRAAPLPRRSTSAGGAVRTAGAGAPPARRQADALCRGPPVQAGDASSSARPMAARSLQALGVPLRGQYLFLNTASILICIVVPRHPTKA